MKISPLAPLLAAAAAVLAAGCSSLDLASSGATADHVLIGSVEFRQEAPKQLPPDAVLTVRVIDPQPPEPMVPLQTSATATAPKLAPTPEVVGEQTVRNLGEPPYAFRVEYRADDDALRHGLTIEARISQGGRLLYSNSDRFSVGLGDVSDPHRVAVDKMAQ